MTADPGSLLSTIAEFSIGLAGFSGIVVVVVGNRRWTEAAKFRASLLIILSLSSGFLALIALGILNRFDGAIVWRVLSGLQAIVAAVALGYSYRKTVTAFGIGPLTRTGRALFSLAGLNVLVQITNTLGFFEPSAFAIFYGGLVVFVLVAAINFYRLIFVPDSDSTPNSGKAPSKKE